MRLRIKVSDIDFQMKINNYRVTPKGEDWESNWCDVELSLISKSISYTPSGELLMSEEVSYLSEALKDLLSGGMEKDTFIQFAEPDLEFDLRIAKRLYNIPGKVSYRDGYQDVDIMGIMSIHFWCEDGLGGNYLNMTLCREEIEAISNYLELVTGKLKPDSAEIMAMLEQGLLLPE